MSAVGGGAAGGLGMGGDPLMLFIVWMLVVGGSIISFDLLRRWTKPEQPEEGENDA